MNAANKPAFTWSDVTQQPEFQSADQAQREDMQLRYFQQVVAPAVPDTQYREFREQFFEATMPDVEVKQPGLLRRSMDAVGDAASTVGDRLRPDEPVFDANAWQAVEQGEGFQQSDTRARHDLRQQFFRDNVAPGLDDAARGDAERDFYAATDIRGTVEDSKWRPDRRGERQELQTWESGATGRLPGEELDEARERATQISAPREDGDLRMSDELVRGLQNAGRGVMQSYYGTRAMLASDEGERQRLLAKSDELREASEQNQATMPQFTEIRSPSDAARWAVHGIGAMAPSVGSIMAGGAAGGKAGGLAGGLAGPKGAALGAVAGSVMGSFSAGYALYAGGMYSDIRQQGGEHEAARSAALKYGAPASAVSIVMPMAFLGSVTGYLGRDFVRSRARNMMLGAGLGGVGEGTAEALAETFTIMGEEEVLGRTMSDEERRSRIINAGAAGGLMGTSMGAVGGGVQRQGDIDTMIDGFIADMERAYSEGASEDVRQAVIDTLGAADSLTENQQAMLDYLHTERADSNRPLNQELKEVQQTALDVYQRDDADNLARFTELAEKQASGRLTGREALEMIALQVNSSAVHDAIAQEAQTQLQIEGDPAAQQQATQDIAAWEAQWRDHEQRNDLTPIDLQQDTGISATVSPGAPATDGRESTGLLDSAMQPPTQMANNEDAATAELLRTPATEQAPEIDRAQQSLAMGDGFAFLWERAAGDSGATDALNTMQQSYLQGDGEGAAQAYQEAMQAIRANERRGAQQERKKATIDAARQEVAAEGGDALSQTIAGEQAETQANQLSEQENAADPIIRPAPPRSPMAGQPMPVGPGSGQGVAGQQSPVGAPQAAQPLAGALQDVPAPEGDLLGDSAPASPLEADAEPGALTPVRVPVDRIQIDPEAYQFRTDVNERGVDDRMEGIKKWDDLRAGELVLHEREDGSLFVADGHHRVDLARRLGQPGVNAFVLREADGYSVEDARRLAAERNIASGASTAIDAAKVFRNTEGDPAQVIEDRDLPRRSQIVRDGADIAKLQGEAFGAVLNNVVSEKDGAAIGRAFDDADQQLAAIDVFQKVKPQNDNQRALLVNEIRQAGFADAQSDQMGMFGDDPSQSLITERVKVMDALHKDLSSNRRLFATLNRNAKTAETAGNVIATEQNEALSDNAARAMDLLGRVTTNPEMNQQINDAARRVNEGQSVAEAVRQLKEVLLRGPESEATQQPAAPDAGRGQAEGRGQEQRADSREPAPDTARAADASQQRLAGEAAEGLTLKKDGSPFATEASALQSGVARRARAQGQAVEAVPSGDGFGVRVGNVDDANATAAPVEETAKNRQDDESIGAQPKAEDYPDLNWEETGGSFGRKRTYPGFVISRNENDRYIATREKDGTTVASSRTLSGLRDSMAMQRNPNTGEAFNRPEPADDFLETQTEESLAQRDRENQQAQQAEADRRRDQEQRADADAEVDDFNLSGSDRTADVLASGGQQSLMEPGGERAPGRSTIREDGQYVGTPSRVSSGQRGEGVSEPRARRGRSRPNAQQPDLLDPANLPQPPQGATPAQTADAQRAARTQLNSDFRLHYEMQPVGTIPVGLTHAATPQDAAHFFAPLRKHGQETMMALVTDSDNKVLGLVRHTKGGTAESSVFVDGLITSMTMFPGATKVWLGHNHPSGSPTPSDADYKITDRIVKGMDASGIDFQGHVIAVAGGRFLTFGTDAAAGQKFQPIKATPANRKASIGLSEKVLRRRRDGDEMPPQASSPAQAKGIVMDHLDGQQGLVLLDNQHFLIGVLPMTDGEMSNLREEGRARRVLETLGHSNASAVITVASSENAHTNMSGFINNLSDGRLRHLDGFVLQADGSDPLSLAEKGRIPVRGDTFFSLGAQSDNRGAPQASEIARLLEGAQELADARVIQSAQDLPPQALLGMALRGVSPADVRGMYVGGDLYVIADNVESAAEGVRVAVHEAVGHKGVRGVLGEEMVPVMRQVYRTLPRDARGREALDDVLRDYPFLDQNNAEHQVMIAEEMIAHLTEKGWNPGPVRRAIAKIRELLRRLFPSMRWTDSDVMALSERSREYLRKQQAEADGDSDAMLFSFAGQRADTADAHALATAEQMLEGGADAEAVRQATGWHRGADGKWRYEIDDSDARFLPYQDGSVRQMWTKPLEEVIDHPALFAAYPDLRQMDVESVMGMGNERGRFVNARGPVALDPDSDTASSQKIMLNADRSPMEQFSTLLHEIQHGIQNVEGFATGGRPADYRLPLMREQWLRDKVKELSRQSSDHMQSLLEQQRAGELALDEVRDRIQAYADEIGLNELRKRLREGDLRGANRYYRRLAGETEARNVQARQGMTEAERAETAPAETQDVADSDVIVTYNGQDMANAPEPANANDVRFSLSSQGGAPTAAEVQDRLKDIKGLGRPEALDSSNQLDLDTGLKLTLRGIDPQSVVAFHDDAGRLRVIAGNAESVEAATNAAVVERVRHNGLKKVVGDRVNTVTNRAYEQIAAGNKAAREALRAARAEFTYLDTSLPADRTALAMEVATRLSERGNPPDFVTTMLDDVGSLLSETHGVTDTTDLGIANRAYLARMQRDFGGKQPPGYEFGLDLQQPPGYGTLTDLAANLVDADGRPINDMVVNSPWTLNPAKGAYRAFVMSQSDRLRESGNRVLVELGNRMDRYFDAEDRRMGQVRATLRPAIQQMQEGGRKQKKQNVRDFEQYWRDWENGRKEKARELYDRSPAVAAMVDAAAEVFHDTGIENRTVKTPTRTGVWVKGKDGFRRIGKITKGQFWPRVMRAEVSEAIRNPNSDPALWDQLVSSLVDAGKFKDKQEAGAWLVDHQRDVYSPEGTNDFYAAIEKARSEQLPEIFYDYSLDVVMDYAHNWARRISQIEQFGQQLRPGDKTAFDEAYALANDERTKTYIGEVSQVVFGARTLGGVGRFMRNTNVLATGLHLTNFGTASQNLTTGTGHNASVFGGRRTLRAYIELAKDYNAVRERGIELGILGKDYLSLIRDADRGRMTGQGDSSHSSQFSKLMEKISGKRISAEEGLREFTKWGMKWGGYNATEQVIRAGAMVSAEFQLADALDVWNKKPNSTKAKKYRRIIRQNRLDVDALIRENGKGEETAKYLRLMVNLPQGSYRGDMVPLLFDTEYGKYFGKYQKFGTQANRTFWQQKMGPMLQLFSDPDATAQDRASAFADVLSYSGWALFSGFMNRKVRSALFGMAFVGADYDEIWDRFNDGEFLLAASLLINNLWNNAMSAGYLFGFFSSPMQAAADYRDRARMRNPMDPPAWAAIEAVGGLVTKYAQQGWRLTGSDLLDAVNRTYGFVRVGERTAATVADAVSPVIDLDIGRLNYEMVRRDVSYIRGATRRWADQTGIEAKMGGSFTPGSTPNTPGNNRIHRAVSVGNRAQASQLVKEELQGLNAEEYRKRLQSIRSSLSARHPLRVAGKKMNQDEVASFRRWARQNLPPSRRETIETRVNDYERAMEAALYRR